MMTKPAIERGCNCVAWRPLLDEPEIADQVLLEHEDMMSLHSDPAGTRRCAREAKPARREPELSNRSAENAVGRTAAAEQSPRTAGRMRQDHGPLQPQRSLRGGFGRSRGNVPAGRK
jgi:hypothetical protein